MFFFIADISGYTDYMLKNQMDYTHGTLIVIKLLNSIIKEVQLPFEIAKIEGDAIFFYLLKDNMPEKYKNDRFSLGKTLLYLFDIFKKELKTMTASTDCQCGGCLNIEYLNLKIIAHYGKATIDKIGNFQELSGVDVILIHRLLKNKIPGHSYLLLTKPAYQIITFPLEQKLEPREEQDKDLGTIPVYVHYPTPSAEIKATAKASSWTLTKSHIALFIGALLLKWHFIKKPNFHNFPSQKN